MSGRALRALMMLLWIIWCGIATVASAAGSPQGQEVLAGGIGEEEAQALAGREKDFNLKLVFSLLQGNYVADVDVSVSDAKGVVMVEQVGTGPLVLVRLPAGSYTVVATQRGKVLTRAVKIDARRLRTEYFRWPADTNEDLPVSRWIDPR